MAQSSKTQQEVDRASVDLDTNTLNLTMIALADCFFLRAPEEGDSDAHFNPPVLSQKRARSSSSSARPKKNRGTDGFSDVVIALEERIDCALADRLLAKLDAESLLYKNLRKYRDALSETGALRVNYHRKDYEIGRLYPRPHISLGVLQRSLRGALCEGRMIDVDMENAHPTFLLKEAQERSLSCARLREYVEDRGRVLGSIGPDRVAAKVTVLSLINNGSLKPEHESSAYLRELFAELRRIRDGIWDAYPDIRRLVEGGNRSNPRASVTSLFMADREQRALLVVAESFRRLGWEVATLVFDGLMVYSRADRGIDDDLPSVAADLERECGVRVNLGVKSWDTSLLGTE